MNGTTFRAMVLAVIWAFPQTILAQDSPPLEPAPEAPTWTVTKELWIAEYVEVVPAALCSHPFFQQCFTAPLEVCQTHAVTVTRECVAEHEASLPEVFQQPTDGAHWGEIIGACAGGRLEVAMSATFTNTPECNDLDHWL